MNCPIDNTAMKVSDKNGVKIDYCPTCKGVWLDRGELDKIIENIYKDHIGESAESKKEKVDYPNFQESKLKYSGPEDTYAGRLFKF